MVLNGFLLGIANGGACLATCAAVLVPLLLGEGRRTQENGWLMLRFLAGRLAGYLLFAVLAWAAGWLILVEPAYRSVIFAVAYIVLAGMMLAYGLGRLKISCAVTPRQVGGRIRRWPALRPWAPALFGLLTGINLCPPFLLAFTNAALNGTLLGSLGFFLAFFMGTTLYLLPVPFIGAFQRAAGLQIIGRLAAGMMAVYYTLSAIMMFVEGAIL